MAFMFCYCKKLKEIDLSGICNNGYKLREMNELIDGCNDKLWSYKIFKSKG